jgi:hypothetical protein
VRDLARLQRLVGNQAVTRLVVQRMPDPDGVVLETVSALHVKVLRIYKDMALPKPSDRTLKATLEELVAAAPNKTKLYESYAGYVVGGYFKGNSSYGEEIKANIVALATGVERATTAGQKKRKHDLAELDKSLPAPPEKTARTDAGKGSEARRTVTYSGAQRNELARKLDLAEIQVKLFGASDQGYRLHRDSARPQIKEAARLNALEKLQPLSTADMASAQANYQHSAVGKALALEKAEGKSYKVTMGRRGGQDINQLATYLPSGTKKSVREDMEKILKDTSLTSKDLAHAVDIREPELLEGFLKGKGAMDWHIGKIRAFRHLRSVEMDRGPETAGGTVLEHRSAVHGYAHITDYPKLTPLGPGEATSDLREARKRHVAEESEEPETYDYIPDDIRDRALKSKRGFLTSFVKNPRPDVEAEALVSAVLEEEETAGPPSEKLISAMRGVMRSPERRD